MWLHIYLSTYKITVPILTSIHSVTPLTLKIKSLAKYNMSALKCLIKSICSAM